MRRRGCPHCDFEMRCIANGETLAWWFCEPCNSLWTMRVQDVPTTKEVL